MPFISSLFYSFAKPLAKSASARGLLFLESRFLLFVKKHLDISLCGINFSMLG
jgi:hypothetical protein